MKRIFALTLLAAFAVGPSSEWLCEHTCGAEPPVTAAEDCHGARDSAQVVVGGHACGDHTSPAAVIPKRTQPESAFVVWARDPSPAVLEMPVSRVAAQRTPADSSPPLNGFLAPLRI